MEPVELIRNFIAERLDGDIDKLATFELTSLNGDKVYGNPKRNFDSDDTELMRAIYCVVFEDVWPDIEQNLKTYKLRGDTLNTFATMFGKDRSKYGPEVHPGLDLHNPSPELVKMVEEYYHLCWSIGNMTVLPNIFVGRDSINTYRGCHRSWHDFEDRFLSALYLQLVLNEPQDKGLAALLEANQDFFVAFTGIEGWKRYIDLHFLNGYVDADYVPVINSMGYYFWQKRYMSDDQYCEEAERYIQFSSDIIKHRAAKMLEIIKAKL